MAGQINIKLNNYVIMILNFEIDLQFGNMQFMILKLKKILFQSPKLCETKINQICFLETSQNVSAEV